MSPDLSCPNAQDPNAGVEDLYPEGTVPELRMGRLSALCSFEHTPRLISGVLRQIFLQHFIDPDHVENSYLRRRLEESGAWSSGPESGIYIEDLARWRPEAAEQRPAILIKAGDWTWRRVGIGDRSGVDARSGAVHHLGLWQGAHTIFAVGNEGPETQLISAEVAKLLRNYGPVICDQMELHRFVVMKLGAMHALKESTENYVIPIDCGYVCEGQWTLQPDAPRLKRITFDLTDLLLDS